MALITASRLGLAYGELEVFSGLDAEVVEHARIGFVGPNGGGKTSLLRVLVGELQADSGSVSPASGLRIGYVPQVPQGAAQGSLRDEIMAAFEGLRRTEDEMASAALDIQRLEGRRRREAERRYAAALQQYEALGGYDYESRMERVVSGVGLSLDTLNTPANVASGGERTRAALARALLSDPDLLVLDEPTNYLDFDGLAWLEGFLRRVRCAFIAVSHDRYFLDQVADHIWELDRGRLRAFRGNYSRYRSQLAERTERQRREYERQQEHIAREESFISRYKAGQRSREARGRETRLAKLQRIEAPQTDRSISLGNTLASRTGQVVVSTQGLRVGFADGGRQVQILSVPDVKLERGSRTAVVGANGVGKTTLLETLLGRIPTLAGSVNLGHNVDIGYHRQGHDDLPVESTVLDALLDIRNLRVEDARTYLGRFLFHGDDVHQSVASLSGGQRTRLALARLLITHPNVLVLDEPTTHLDIPSREALEQTLLAYDGTLLLVSHDRHLISLLAGQLWVVAEGEARLFPGRFEEWIESTRPGEAQQQGPVRPPRPPARGRHATRAAKPPPREEAPDYEQLISDLETRLAEIERALEEASERQDVAEITRLAEQHKETQGRLAQALEHWGA